MHKGESESKVKVNAGGDPAGNQDYAAAVARKIVLDHYGVDEYGPSGLGATIRLAILEAMREQRYAAIEIVQEYFGADGEINPNHVVALIQNATVRPKGTE